MTYTKLNAETNYYEISSKQQDDTWEEVTRDEDGKTTSPLGLVEQEAKETIYIPQAISMRQARLELLNQGKLSTVESTIASMSGEDGERARISWNYSANVYRNEALVESIGLIIGMNSEQIDTMFINAEKL